MKCGRTIRPGRQKGRYLRSHAYHRLPDTFVILPGMAFGALEPRNVAQVQWMLKRSVALVASGTLPCIAVAKFDRVLEPAIRRDERNACECLIERCVADGTVVSYHFPLPADVLPVVAPKTALCIEVAYVVDMT